MSETKFTPGPWTLVDREVLEDSSVYPMHILGGVTCLEVCLMEDLSVAYEIVKNPNWHHMTKSPMKLANAHLIASAPELYGEHVETMKTLIVLRGNIFDAAKTDRRWDGMVDVIQERIDAIDAALSKARGES